MMNNLTETKFKFEKIIRCSKKIITLLVVIYSAYISWRNYKTSEEIEHLKINTSKEIEHLKIAVEMNKNSKNADFMSAELIKSLMSSLRSKSKSERRLALLVLKAAKLPEKLTVEISQIVNTIALHDNDPVIRNNAIDVIKNKGGKNDLITLNKIKQSGLTENERKAAKSGELNIYLRSAEIMYQNWRWEDACNDYNKAYSLMDDVLKKKLVLAKSDCEHNNYEDGAKRYYITFKN